MACTQPMKAYRKPGGGVVFTGRAGFYDLGLMELPCGQCMSCRLSKMRDWAIRCVHEAQMVTMIVQDGKGRDQVVPGPSCFVTLTYNDENLPKDNSVNVRHWQLFAKRLRKRMGPFRFLHCGEYGDDKGRAHYHALLFGIGFVEDRVALPTEGEHTKWTSKTLDEIWGKGFCQIGSVSFDSAAYCARYALKKLSGKKAAESGVYERIDSETGEVFTVHPAYATMSRRPGLGTAWFEKFQSDVYPDDFVVMKGQKMRPPKFYDALLEKSDPGLMMKLKLKRRENQNEFEETFERRDVRAKVVEARINMKTREL